MKNMYNWFADVKTFHEVFGQNVGSNPSLPNENERNLRKRLLEEEYNEYLDGEKNNDIVEIADALADIIYIACGTAVSYGIPLDKIFAEVHRSNMSKLVNGKSIFREDGKILKGENYSPPNIEQFINVSEGE